MQKAPRPRSSLYLVSELVPVHNKPPALSDTRYGSCLLIYQTNLLLYRFTKGRYATLADFDNSQILLPVLYVRNQRRTTLNKVLVRLHPLKTLRERASALEEGGAKPLSTHQLLESIIRV